MSIKKRVPKTLDQCREADTISQSLWQWEKRVKAVGTVVLTLTVICGLVLTVFIGMLVYQLSQEDETTTVLSVLVGLVLCFLCGVVVYAGFYTKALKLGAAASIVHNTHVTANLAMYTNNGFKGEYFSEDPDDAGDDAEYGDNGIPPQMIQ